jgi:single-strand DNA-binding protein
VGSTPTGDPTPECQLINKVILLGNLGSDPELRNVGSSSVCDLSLATTSKWTAKDGSHKADTQWHRVVVWGKQAESCKEYLSKGRQIYVEGHLQTRQWEDRDGNKRYTTEVVAETVKFLGGGRDRAPTADPPGEQASLGNDDIPF